jgi:hypothetical protein
MGTGLHPHGAYPTCLWINDRKSVKAVAFYTRAGRAIPLRFDIGRIYRSMNAMPAPRARIAFRSG